MTGTFYLTKNYNADYSSFGGIIYKGDFDKYHSLSDIASRIVLDTRFDKQCKKNTSNRNRQKEYQKENS